MKLNRMRGFLSSFIPPPSSLLRTAMPRSNKTISLRELRVGLLVLISIAVLIFLVLERLRRYQSVQQEAASESSLH